MKNTDKKVVKKSTKKVAKKVVEFKPDYIYDITCCETMADILYVFGASNLIYGLPVSAAMYEALVAGCKEDILSIAGMLFDGNILVRHGDTFVEPVRTNVFTIKDDEKVTIKNGKMKVKKKNIFKRFWNWITRKK